MLILLLENDEAKGSGFMQTKPVLLSIYGKLPHIRAFPGPRPSGLPVSLRNHQIFREFVTVKARVSARNLI